MSFIGWYRAGINIQAHLPVLSTFLGHSSTEATYWYLQAIPELLGLAAQRLEPDLSRAHPPLRRGAWEAAMTILAPIPEAFFTDRLMTQRAAAPHTIASYRDTCKLLLGYIHTQTGKPPSKLDLTGLDAATTGAFLSAELDVFLSAPDRSTWHGRRDHALLVLAAQTELRGSELTGLTIDDFLAAFLQ